MIESTTVITLVDGTMRTFEADFGELVGDLQGGANVLILQEAGRGAVAIPVSAVLSIRDGSVRDGLQVQGAGVPALADAGDWPAI